MGAFSEHVYLVFDWVRNSTMQASLLIVLVFVIHVVLRHRLNIRWQCCLWLLVLVRMAMPCVPESRLSLFNLLPGESNAWQIGAFTDVGGTGSPATGGIPTEAIPVLTDTADSPASQAARLSPETPVDQSPVQFMEILPLIWFAGAVLLTVYVVAMNVRLWFVVSRERLVTNQRVLDSLEESKSRIGVRAVIAVVETDVIRSPALFGFIRPKILLPAGLAEQLGDEELGHVFLHELAHLRRYDIYVGWLMALLQAMHWFNPLVWIGFNRMRADRELACDSMALSAMSPSDSKRYGRTILNLAERFSIPRYAPAVAGILEAESKMSRRIKMISQFKVASCRSSVFGIFIIVLMACGTLTNARSLSNGKDLPADTVDAVALVEELAFRKAAIEDVVRVFGTPNKYWWEDQQFSDENLPERFFASYSNGISVFMTESGIEGIRFEQPGYVVGGSIQVGSTVKEMREVLGDPTHTVASVGKDYRSDSGEKTDCYFYESKQRPIRLFVSNDRVIALDLGPSGEKVVLDSESRIDKEGRIVDKLDYPFVDDPQVIGIWKSVDFVPDIAAFDSEKRRFQGDLYLKELVIRNSGRTNKGYWTWTKGMILNSRARTASKYVVKEIDGEMYMFFEWKSGDYTVHHQRPSYYVLKKISSDAEAIGKANSKPLSREAFRETLAANVAKLDINEAGRDEVIEVFGEPEEYSWGVQKFESSNLPGRYIMVYPASFSVYMRNGRIVELRFYESGFTFDSRLAVGSTLDQVIEVLGTPDETVEGRKNNFVDGVLYKDIEDKKGACYYARSAKNVRVFLVDNKVASLFVTRSNSN